MRTFPLPIRTMYADLVERCSLASAVRDFPSHGVFYAQRHKGRDYWYFRMTDPATGKRPSRYVGPDTPEIRRVIDQHKVAKDDYRERRQLVAALKRAGYPAPDPLIGRVLTALADAGVFRLGAVIVGSVAYQCYTGVLGVRLGSANVMTSDVDLAQFRSISLAVGDSVDIPIEEILRSVDEKFRPIPGLRPADTSTRYALGERLAVDILTPNQGPDSSGAIPFPALQAEAQGLRFLDFLIYQEIRAVALYGGGVVINVPAPERFAIHKLIVSQRRARTAEGLQKTAKDLTQAGALIEALADQDPPVLMDAWDEARQRGPTWARLMDKGRTRLAPSAAAALSYALDEAGER